MKIDKSQIFIMPSLIKILNIPKIILRKMSGVLKWVSEIQDVEWVFVYLVVFLMGHFLEGRWPPEWNKYIKNGFLNKYLVRYCILWTSLLIFVFLAVDKFQFNTSRGFYWSFCFVFWLILLWKTNMVIYDIVGNYIGECKSKIWIRNAKLCISAKFRWIKFDISGHAFVMTFCVLCLNFAKVQSGFWGFRISHYDYGDYAFGATWLLFWAVVFLQCIWIVMYTFTMLFFHTSKEKLLGILFGVFSYKTATLISFYF